VLTVVTGPPCGGKSTHIRERAKPGDIVIDLDRIALALASEDTEHHTYPEHLIRIAQAARRAAIDAALPMRQATNVWIIDTTPSKRAWALYRQAGAHVVKCDPGPAIVAARLRDTGRPERAIVAARAYYADRHSQ